MGWRWYSAPRGHSGTQPLFILWLHHSLGPRNPLLDTLHVTSRGKKRAQDITGPGSGASTYLHSMATSVSEFGKSIFAMGPEGKETGLDAHRAFQSRIRTLS